jgi:hypothetical protein
LATVGGGSASIAAASGSPARIPALRGTTCTAEASRATIAAGARTKGRGSCIAAIATIAAIPSRTESMAAIAAIDANSSSPAGGSPRRCPFAAGRAISPVRTEEATAALVAVVAPDPGATPPVHVGAFCAFFRTNAGVAVGSRISTLACGTQRKNGRR